jgi:hypothetical protein
MRRGPVLVLGSLLAACAASSAASSSAPGTAPLASGSPDASGEFTFTEDSGSDASVLLSSCTPGDVSSCPVGFTCYPRHTSSSWWVDLYGKCTFGCTAQTLALCASFDGVCGCPVSADGTSNCFEEGGVAPVSSSDAGVVSTSDAGGDAAAPPYEDAGPELPAPITPTSEVCVPAVKPGTQPGANEGDGGCGTPGCAGGADAGALPNDGGGAG